MSISFGRFALNVVNRLLALFNVELNTLTVAREENRRVKAAVSRGDFEQPIYTLPASFHSERFKEILAALPGYSHRFSSFRDSDKNDVGYSFQNGFFSSPDAEVLYCMVRTACPRRIVEIGCGNSTKIIRQAIRDGGFPCQHTCVDPFPREEVSSLTDIVIREKIETIDPTEILGKLAQGDMKSCRRMTLLIFTGGYFLKLLAGWSFISTTSFCLTNTHRHG
jgi:hypothetical protein